MGKSCELLIVKDEERQAVLKHYNMTESDLKDKIDYLLEWHKKSGYPHDGKIFSLIIANKNVHENVLKNLN